MSFRLSPVFTLRRCLRVVPVLFVLPFVLLLSGCGSTELRNGLSDPFPSAIPALKGSFHGGQQPVTGAAIQLYAAGSAGYGSAGRPLVNCTGPVDANNIPTAPCQGVTTDSTGSFAISATYTCPPGAYVYIMATGGNPGGATSNSALAAMVGLGACSNLTNNTYININEVTTAASVMALQQFMTATYGTAFAESVGAPTSNAIGLQNAFAAIPQMVNIATGTALANGTSTAPVNGTSVVLGWTSEQSKLNTLGNVLASCVNSVDSAGPPATISPACSSLFSAAKPSAQTSAPADTVQAMLNLAINPTNVSGPFALVNASPAFAPVLTTAPNDWTMSLGYYSNTYYTVSSVNYPFLAGSYSVAIDANGVAWILNFTTNSDVSAIAPGGVPYAEVLTGINGPRSMALDASGNIFTANYGVTTAPYSGSISECVIAGTACSTVKQFTGASNIFNLYAIALDGNGNAYAAARNGGTAPALVYVPANAATGATITTVGTVGVNATGVAADPAGNVWTAAISGSGTLANPSLVQIAPGCSTNAGVTTCTPTTINSYTGGSTTPGKLVAPYGVAIDSSGNAWVGENNGSATTGNAVVKVTPSAATGSNVIATAGAGTAANAGGASNVQFVAIDGNNNVWAVDNGTFAGTAANGPNTGSAVSEFTSAGAALSGANGFQINFLTNGSTPTQSTTTTSTTLTNGPRAIAIDGSGNVWITNSNAGANSTASAIIVNEIVGQAVPVVTPLALAIKTSKLGQKP